MRGDGGVVLSRRASERGRSRGARRAVALGAAASIGLLSVAAPGRAQPEPSQVREGIVLGTGKATASVLQPVLAAGELKLNVIVGEASSNYQDETARAASTTLDVPLLRAGASTVCGQPATDFGALLPAPVAADTAKRGNREPVSAASDPGQDLVLTQRAKAVPGAKASSETTIASLATGLIDLHGIRATTEVGVDPDTRTRTATARTDVADVSLLGGLVRIEGPRWLLSQRQVGADHRADERSLTSRFTLGAIVISPAAVPAGLLEGLAGLGGPLLDQLVAGTELRIPLLPEQPVADLLATVNPILAPLGLRIQLPELTSPKGVDRHELSPLRVVVGGPDWILAPVFSQLLNNPAAAEIQNALVETLFDPAACQQLGGLMQGIPELNSLYNSLGSYAPFLLAIVTGVLGGGEVALNVGGVATELDDTYYPPLSFGGPVLSSSPPPVTAAEVALDRPAPGGSSPSAPSAAITSSRASSRCETTSPAGRPGCWIGNARLAVALASATVVALFAVDEVVRRRRTRQNPTEEIAR